MRVVVTGADGFVGRHLCRHLLERGDTVFALTGQHASRAEASDGWQRRIDLLEPAAVAAALAEAQPEGVIHLAGFSSVGKSYQDPASAYAVNVLGTVHLLTAIRAHAPSARVIAVSSGEVYGPIEPGSSATEAHATLPLSPYSASKLAGELACRQAQHAGLDLMIARPFNHLGRGQSANFVLPAFAGQLAAIAMGRGEHTLKVGDLTPVRDFSHVADVVEAYRLLLERGESGQIYNIASGAGRSIRELLDELIELARLEVAVEPDAERFRPSEIHYLVGNGAKLRRLGWKPTRTVTGALRDVWEEARANALAESERHD